MAKEIPGFDNSPMLSQNVPGVQFPFRQEFGRQGKALEELGGNIERAADTGAAINDEIQRQHDISTASQATAEAFVAHNQMREKILMSSPDGLVRDPQTGEVIQNRDETQKTVAQQYWEDADHDFQTRQQDMTPRSAAMFREMFQKHIMENTSYLQKMGMERQAQDSDQKVDNVKDTFSRDMQRKPVPDTALGSSGQLVGGGYYSGEQDEDGAVKQYPSAQKAYDAIQAVQLIRQQKGPIQGRPGQYGPTEVEALKKKDASDLSNNWLTSMQDDLLESNGSRAGLHKNLKDASSTATMQIHSLLDIVDGKDPESQRRISQGLPTINNSLSPEQIAHWKQTLLGMAPAAKEVDKSEYELQKNQLTDFAKSTKSLDQFFLSPLFQKTSLAGGGLGLTAQERLKDLSPIVAEAISSAATASVGGIASPDAKRKAADAILASGGKHWEQLAGMMGEKDTTGFAQAITSEASKQVAAKLQEDTNKMLADPMKYAGEIRQGPQGPGGVPKFNDNGTAHTIDTRLNPANDPSLFAIFKPMGGGKSILETAQGSANNVYSRIFKSQANVSILNNEQFKDQAKRLVNSNDPRQISEYFRQLSNSKLSPAQQETFIQDLVHKGDLPQTYVDALNLKTPTEREAVWAKLKSGPSEIPDGITQKVLDQSFVDHNKGPQLLVDRKYGVNSDIGRTTMLNYRHSWQESVKQAMGRGMSENEAYEFADNERDKTMSDVGTVGAQHDFFLFHTASGPQVPVEYGKEFSPGEKQNINDTLLRAQSPDNLKKFKFAPAPGALLDNPNATPDAENVANKLSLWRRIGGGWRLQMQETDKENRPTGQPQDVQVYGADGKSKHFIEVTEDQAKAGAGPGHAKSVVPSQIKTRSIPLVQPETGTGIK